MNLNEIIDPEKETINYDISRLSAIKEAKEKGLIIIYPEDDELLINIDTKEQLEIFIERTEYLTRFFEFDFEIDESQSGPPHYHIRVKFEDMILDDMDRIFLQLFLGSDPTREFLSFLRIQKGEDYPTLFLEKKKQEVQEMSEFLDDNIPF